MRLQLCISAVLAQVHTGCAAQLYSWSVGSLEPGSDLHIANYSNLTAAEEWCSSHSLCQGFTYDGGAHGGAPLGPVPLEPLPGPGGDRRPCYLRSDINISACGNGTRHLFVLDMDTSQWSPWTRRARHACGVHRCGAAAPTLDHPAALLVTAVAVRATGGKGVPAAEVRKHINRESTTVAAAPWSQRPKTWRDFERPE